MSRLVVVSNRVAALDGKPAAGGLAVALTQVLRRSGGLWFGWSGRTLDENSVGETHLQEIEGITYGTVDLSRTSHRGHYEGYSNQTLWPLFHHRVDLAVFDRKPFEQYQAVNRFFAQRLAPLLQERDLVWVHDYHLIPLGEELRRYGCNQRVGFFLHTPFPAPEILVTLFNHKRLVRSLLAYDLVGFQTETDLRSFRDYVLQELRGETISHSRIRAYGNTFQAGAFPISIDPEAFAQLASSVAARRYGDRVRKSLPDKALILSVDRLDYTKGLPERLAAMAQLFNSYPEHCGQVTFMQIASPTRGEVPQYSSIRRRVEAAVGQINGRYAESDWTPVRYVSKTYSQAQLCGLYQLGRVGVVTPLRDGMNLVAKEFVAAQDQEDPGVLILSRFAGAADEMDAALIVNPYDTVEVSAAVHQALRMSHAERAERWNSLMNGLLRNNVTTWRTRFLAELFASRS